MNVGAGDSVIPVRCAHPTSGVPVITSTLNAHQAVMKSGAVAKYRDCAAVSDGAGRMEGDGGTLVRREILVKGYEIVKRGIREGSREVSNKIQT